MRRLTAALATALTALLVAALYLLVLGRGRWPQWPGL